MSIFFTFFTGACFKAGVSLFHFCSEQDATYTTCNFLNAVANFTSSKKLMIPLYAGLKYSDS